MRTALDGEYWQFLVLIKPTGAVFVGVRHVSPDGDVTRVGVHSRRGAPTGLLRCGRSGGFSRIARRGWARCYHGRRGPQLPGLTLVLGCAQRFGWREVLSMLLIHGLWHFTDVLTSGGDSRLDVTIERLIF